MMRKSAIAPPGALPSSQDAPPCRTETLVNRSMNFRLACWLVAFINITLLVQHKAPRKSWWHSFNIVIVLRGPPVVNDKALHAAPRGSGVIERSGQHVASMCNVPWLLLHELLMRRTEVKNKLARRYLLSAPPSLPPHHHHHHSPNTRRL